MGRWVRSDCYKVFHLLLFFLIQLHYFFLRVSASIPSNLVINYVSIDFSFSYFYFMFSSSSIARSSILVSWSKTLDEPMDFANRISLKSIIPFFRWSFSTNGFSNNLKFPSRTLESTNSTSFPLFLHRIQLGCPHHPDHLPLPLGHPMTCVYNHGLSLPCFTTKANFILPPFSDFPLC